MNYSKLIAFYLPQFHPIPENNAWWGAGFTEWSNVSVARPRFKGHYQPHIPADLGFYDLRLEESRMAQANLAREYGISGFCYYHYWFNGKTLLERPLKEVLESGKPDFPFCMCWANENWTRAWDGLERQVLIKQEYTTEDSRHHFKWLTKRFRDPRYIKINGCPLFLVYRLDTIPNVREYFAAWRKWAKDMGFPGLFLCAVKNGFIEMEDWEIINSGFDAIVDFQPNRNDFPSTNSVRQYVHHFASKILPEFLYQMIKHNVSVHHRLNYRAFMRGLMLKKWPVDFFKFPCVFPSWDNTPRRKTPTIIQNDDPSTYEHWLTHALGQVTSYPPNCRFVFINAWNEWAEGCHLEPDRKHGHAFLQATKSALFHVNETKNY